MCPSFTGGRLFGIRVWPTLAVITVENREKGSLRVAFDFSRPLVLSIIGFYSCEIVTEVFHFPLIAKSGILQLI